MVLALNAKMYASNVRMYSLVQRDSIHVHEP